MKTTRITGRILACLGVLALLASSTQSQQVTLQLGNVFGQPESAYISIPHSPELEPELITIEAWVTPIDFGQNYTNTIGTMIVGKVKQGVHPAGGSSVASWWLGFRPVDRRITAGFAQELAGNGLAGTNEFTSSLESIDFGRRAHVAYVFDGAFSEIFIDGVSQGVCPVDPSMNTIEGYEQDEVLIGSANLCCGTNMRFHGNVDEIRVWNYPRTPAQIRRSMHCRLTGSQPGLVGYWNFDGGDFLDRSGNGNHGTMNGSAWDFIQDVPYPDCNAGYRRTITPPVLLPRRIIPGVNNLWTWGPRQIGARLVLDSLAR